MPTPVLCVSETARASISKSTSCRFSARAVVRRLRTRPRPSLRCSALDLLACQQQKLRPPAGSIKASTSGGAVHVSTMQALDRSIRGISGSIEASDRSKGPVGYATICWGPLAGEAASAAAGGMERLVGKTDVCSGKLENYY